MLSVSNLSKHFPGAEAFLVASQCLTESIEWGL